MDPQPNRRTRAYVGALPVAATLLALAVPGVTASSASAMAPTGASATTVLDAGAGYQPGGSPLVRHVQRLLAKAGYPPGPIDGRYGPLTESAVTRYQADRGLEVDGVAGPQTLGALTTARLVLYPGAGYEPDGSPLVRRLQRLLLKAGYAPGPVDGRYGPRTGQAVTRYQLDHGLQPSGVAGSPMLARLRVQPGAAHPVAHRPLAAPPATRVTAPASQPHSSVPIAWLALLGALGVTLLLASSWRARRSRAVRAARGAPNGRDRGTAEAVAPERARDAPVRVREPLTRARRPLEVPANGVPRGPVNGRRPAQSSNGRSHHPAANGRENGQSGDITGAFTDVAGTFNSGVLLEEQGDVAGAEAAYRRADQHGHAAAASNLGALLEGRGEAAGAEAAYRRADQRGEAVAAFNLGVLLEAKGDPGAAEAAYRRADERGHAAAASNLGVLLEAKGDVVGAEAAYRRADARGEANGAFNLGVLLEERGDLPRAEAAYRRAGDRGPAQVAQMARSALRDLEAGLEYAGASARSGREDGP